MTTPYTTGQISLVNGSALVTGIGTGWETSLIIGGTIFVEADGGNALPIADIGGDTAITAAIAWTGPTGTYDYALVRDTAYGQQTVANAQALADYIQRLNNSALAAISGVNPASEMVLMFTGPDTATVVPRSAFIQGGEYDVQVNNLAARSAYDSKPGPTATNRGFAVLVSNIGDGRAAIYSKLSDTAGDWSQPGPLTGAKGDSGPFTEITIGTTTTLAYGSQATVTSTVIDADTIRLDFGIPAGQDGTGTGDVVGPSSSVDNELALFSGASGKQIKRGPLLSSLGSGQNEAILALEIADLKGSRLGMKGGVADAVDDETGVDVKTNAVYDATNDWYTPAVAGGATSYSNAGGSGNRSSSIAVTSAGFTFSGGTPALLVDGNTANNALYFTGGSGQTGYIQFDFGAGNAKYIDQFSFYQVASYAGTGPWSWSGSNDGVNFTTLVPSFSLASGNPAIIDVPAHATAYRYFRLSGNNAAYGGGYLNEITFRISSAPPSLQNMTLRSVAYAAASVPTTGRIAVQTVETDAITINSDLIARLSRDGGSTWATASLALSQSLVGSRIYEASGISLSSLGSGTSMKWEVSTANNKNVAVSGVVFQWS